MAKHKGKHGKHGGKAHKHPHREHGHHDGGPHHIGHQHKGDAMHLHSHAGKDPFHHGMAGSSGHSENEKHMGSLCEGYNPPEDYRGGVGGYPNETAD